MDNSQKKKAIMNFNAIGVVNSDLISKETLKENAEVIVSCISRFLNYDFGEIDTDQEAQNNISILIGHDNFFGSYELAKGRLSIALYEGRYRFVFEERKA